MLNSDGPNQNAGRLTTWCVLIGYIQRYKSKTPISNNDNIKVTTYADDITLTTPCLNTDNLTQLVSLIYLSNSI